MTVIKMEIMLTITCKPKEKKNYFVVKKTKRKIEQTKKTCKIQNPVCPSGLYQQKQLTKTTTTKF